jgi:hypothetical protein
VAQEPTLVLVVEVRLVVIDLLYLENLQAVARAQNQL